MEQKVFNSWKNQKRLSFSMQIISVSQSSIRQLSKRLGDQPRSKEKARRQSRKIQKRSGVNQRQIQARHLRAERLQLTLHWRHERCVQTMRRIRKRKTWIFHWKIHKATQSLEYLWKNEVSLRQPKEREREKDTILSFYKKNS